MPVLIGQVGHPGERPGGHRSSLGLEHLGPLRSQVPGVGWAGGGGGFAIVSAPG